MRLVRLEALVDTCLAYFWFFGVLAFRLRKGLFSRCREPSQTLEHKKHPLFGVLGALWTALSRYTACRPRSPERTCAAAQPCAMPLRWVVSRSRLTGCSPPACRCTFVPAEEAVASHTERKPLKTTPSGRRLRAGAAGISMLSLNMSNLNRGSCDDPGRAGAACCDAVDDVC